MSQYTGFVQAGLQLGLDAILVKPKRGLYNIIGADNSALADIIAMATIEEHHLDQMELTEHPVEIGAPIADHAYKRPAEVTLNLAWSNSPNKDSGLVSGAIATAAANNATANRLANVAAIGVGVVNLATTIQASLNGKAVGQMIDVYNALLKMQALRSLFDLYTGKRVYQNMFCKSISTPTDYKSENSLFITMHCQQIILASTQTVQLPKAVQKNPDETASPVNNGTVSPSPTGAIPLPAAAGKASAGNW
jgi:hypothetical protein